MFPLHKATCCKVSGFTGSFPKGCILTSTFCNSNSILLISVMKKKKGAILTWIVITAAYKCTFSFFFFFSFLIISFNFTYLLSYKGFGFILLNMQPWILLLWFLFPNWSRWNKRFYQYNATYWEVSGFYKKFSEKLHSET